MILDSSSKIVELRNELEIKKKKALGLQMQTTDPKEWKSLNLLRWELEDLDKDIYLSQFIKNNDKLEVLIKNIVESKEEASKIVSTINNITDILKAARSNIKKTSTIFNDLNDYYIEVESLIKTITS